MMRARMSIVACAILLATCGGKPPTGPTPGGGGNGGGSGGGSGGGGGVVVNTPPVVRSITVSDTRVEVGSPVTLTVVVEDAETPVDNLIYAWSGLPPGSGSATGSPRTFTFTPGASVPTPGDFEIRVTVTERYTSGGQQLENSASGAVTLHINNSPKELQELSLRFLGDFANSRVSPEKCVSEFTDSCNGKKDELADVEDIRHDYEHIGSTLRHTSLSIASNKMSATVHTFCSFTVKVITTSPRDEFCEGGKNCPLGSTGTATGDCWTTNVYEKGRWWLCDSHFTSQATVSGISKGTSTFVPTLFRRRIRLP